MIIQSEITGKSYKTVEECLEAEKAYKAKVEAEKKAKEEKQAKLDAAFKDIRAAWDAYIQTYTDLGYKVRPTDEYFLALEVIAND